MYTNSHKFVAYELYNCIFMIMPLKAINDASIHHDIVHSKQECDRELPRECYLPATAETINRATTKRNILVA